MTELLVSEVCDIEMIRDGGSLQASFLTANGAKYCLWFELIMQLDAQGLYRRVGYVAPTVFERLELYSHNKFEWQAANEMKISWDQALTVLDQFRFFLLNDRQTHWLEVMQKVALLHGGLPDELQLS